MSLQNLVDDYNKPWLNIRANQGRYDGNLLVQNRRVDNDMSITLRNEAESGNDSHASLKLHSTIATGDPKQQFGILDAVGVDVDVWSHGIDNSDGDKYKISNSRNLGTNDFLIFDQSTSNIELGTGVSFVTPSIVGNPNVDIDAPSGYISLDANANSNFSTNGNLTLYGENNVSINSGLLGGVPGNVNINVGNNINLGSFDTIFTNTGNQIIANKPTVNNAQSDFLVRNSITGAIQIRDDITTNAVTVATTGAQFTTVQQAYSAGYHVINIIGNTIDTVNIDLSGTNDALIINLLDGVWTLNDCNILLGNTTFPEVYIQGNSFNQNNIIYQATSGSRAMIQSGNGSACELNNLYIRNLSTQINSPIIGLNTVSYIFNCYFSLPNLDNCGINLDVYSFLNNIQIEGGGANCDNAFIIGAAAGIKCNDITFYGQFNATTAISVTDCCFNNVYYQTNAVTLITATDSIITGLYSEGAMDLSLIGSTLINCKNNNTVNLSMGANSCLSNSNFSTLASTFNADNICISNIIVTTSATKTGAMGNRFSLSNSIFNGATGWTLNGTYMSINNNSFTQGLTITGDNNRIIGNMIGANGGGGANTITLNAGSDNNIVTNNQTDVAIVDNGAGNSLGNNIVF